MLTRRQLLTRSAAGGAILMAPSGLLTSPAAAQGRALRKFRTACPTPGGSWPIIDARGGGPVSLNLQQFAVTVHPDLGPTTVWGYEPAAGPPANRSTYLGPTVVAQRGTPVDVTYNNLLPPTPLFPTDPMLVPPSHVDSSINTHLHGGRIGDSEDGNPFNAYPPNSPGGQNEVPPASNQTMTYANEQSGTLLWYHDHALGTTRTNVYAGLAGGYLLTEPGLLPPEVPTAFDSSGVPDPYNPAGNIPLHIPLVIQDKDLGGKGQLRYPFPWVPEFFARNCLVNGRAFPFLEVQPRVYRFTFLNGSQSRFYNLGLVPSRGAGAPAITQIGVELGPIDSPTPIPNIVIAPAERADVLIDFRGLQPGQRVVLTDGPLPAGVVSPTRPLGDCMEFRLVGPGFPAQGGQVPAPPAEVFGPPFSSWPGWTATSGTPRPATGAATSKATFEEVLGQGGKPVMAVVNGTPFMLRDAAGNMTDNPSDPWSTETIVNGSTVEWIYLNLTADSHPFHTHLGHFEVVSRRTFNAVLYLTDLNAQRGPAWTTFNAGQPGAPANIGQGPAPPIYDPSSAGYPDPTAAAYTPGPVVNAPPQEKGPKDTVIANPGEITRIRLKFELPTGTAPPARYVFHCHILEHEENEMMRPIRIT